MRPILEEKLSLCILNKKYFFMPLNKLYVIIHYLNCSRCKCVEILSCIFLKYALKSIFKANKAYFCYYLRIC